MRKDVVAEPAGSGAVQSIQRAFDLLEAAAAAGGRVTLSDLATATGLAPGTIHRLLGTLVSLGYMRQLPDRRYALGFRLVPLGEAAESLLGPATRPVLAGLVAELGESANLAVLDGDLVAYIGQVPSPRSMRMFTEVGRRVHPHCTGVGKALLARLPEQQVRAILERVGMPASTERTVTEVDALLAELAATRDRGYAIDDGEQEIGVRCLAMAVPTDTARIAISVSGPEQRMTGDFDQRAVAALSRACETLAAALP
ncbi:MAG: IclR family transcriptional regulator [Actinomycetes bacterium]